MKKHSYFIIIFIFITLVKVNSFGQSISEIVERVDSSVVMVITYDVTGSSVGQGSGVFVTNDGKILTNAHVIKDAYSAEVKSSIGTFNKVVILYKDESKDLALIQVTTSNSVPPEFDFDSELKAGQRVIAIGNPLGLEKTVSDGLISGIRKLENGVELIQTSVPISPGSSGGVLLNEDGLLIGITTSTLLEGQNINFAISLNTIIWFVEDFQKANSKSLSIEQLKLAKESVWYRVILHWLGNILLVIISALFGGSFYFVIPLLMIGGYILFGIIKGLWWLIYYPFRKAKEKKERIIYGNFISQTNNNASSDYSSAQNDYDNIYEEENSNKELEDGPLDFYCPKCGNKNQVQNSSQGEMVNCISCGKSIMIPFD